MQVIAAGRWSKEDKDWRMVVALRRGTVAPVGEKKDRRPRGDQ